MPRLLYTLRQQLLAITLAVFGMASVVMLWSTREVVLQVGAAEARRDGQRSGSLLSTALTARVAQRDIASLEETLASLVTTDDFVYIQVSDDSGTVLAKAGQTQFLQQTSSVDVHRMSSPLSIENRIYGQVQFGLAREAEKQLVNLIFWRILFACVSCLALAGVAQAYFSGVATRRLALLRRGSERMASGEQGVEIPDHGRDEMAALAQAFNRMSRALTDRERQLQDINQQLEKRVEDRTQHLENALKTLRLTQDDLVEAQKLSSLGSLVAGVSHELNTPIGNAVTAASALDDTLRELTLQVESQAVSRKALVQTMTTGREMAALVLSSVERAANLIASFKRMAVDDTSQQRRLFDLRSTLEDLLRAFAPTLKRCRWTVQMEVPVGIQMDSFPGPLDQIVGNILQNAERHAFAPEQEGVFTIAAHTAGDQVFLSLSDTGQGMPPEIASRIFEPFFTTKLGQGGSGLGLPIVRNLVHGMLGGHMTVHSVLGKGTRFEVQLPLCAPATKAE